MNHTDIINHHITKNNYKRYLEVGVQFPDHNFNKILAPEKVGVDTDMIIIKDENVLEPHINNHNFIKPHTLFKRNHDDCKFINSACYQGTFYHGPSEYFWELPDIGMFDCIFIDGLHHASAVFWDIINGLDHLNKGGTLFCHDLNPDSEAMQAIPRQEKVWTGNGWKAWVLLRQFLLPHHYEMSMYREDYGIGMIKKLSHAVRLIPDYKSFSVDKELYWGTVNELPA